MPGSFHEAGAAREELQEYVPESGRRLSEAACAKRQTNWRRVWVIGGTCARPESPGIAAVSPGMAAVISRHGLTGILAKFRLVFVKTWQNSAMFEQQFDNIGQHFSETFGNLLKNI